jgi:hypothetical protein
MSVRKAALGVIGSLLRALPGESQLAQLWVQAALPMVRDVEASLQEQLLDQFHEFVISPAGKLIHAMLISSAYCAEVAYVAWQMLEMPPSMLCK